MKYIKEFENFNKIIESSDIDDVYNRSDFSEDSISSCCGSKFVQGDICKECGEHSVPSEEEDAEDMDDINIERDNSQDSNWNI